MKKPTETDLVRQCLDLLSLRRVFHWRANAGGGLRVGSGGRMVPVMANPEGTPDIIAFVPSKTQLLGNRGVHTAVFVLAIECKSESGRLRDSQKAWRDNAESAGVRYLVVRDVRELESVLTELGVK